MKSVCTSTTWLIYILQHRFTKGARFYTSSGAETSFSFRYGAFLYQLGDIYKSEHNFNDVQRHTQTTLLFTFVTKINVVLI